ncbi:hypothetical protein C8R45DRAFT_268871 [Mycena sanguinolenta]|nr:hypothetical protein C8R45DRAFT_268871 [Mycena sanguinolenta]
MSAPPYGGHGGNPPSMYSRQSQGREMTDPTPQTQRRNTMPTRHSSEPPERRRSTDTLPALDRPLDRPRAYQRDSAPHQPEIFTTPRDLQPTFSTNIVRTPQHYKSRSSSTGPQPQSLYGPPSSRNSIDPQQLASRMEQLSTQPNPLSRHSSLPQPLSAQSTGSSMTGVASYVDEPTSMLSPLVLPMNDRPHKHSSRSLGRHSSVPVVNASSSLSAIPEGNDPPRRSPHHSPRHGSPHRDSQRRSRHTSPAARGPGPGLTVTPPAPLGLTPPRPNPLPDPPQELSRHPGISLPVQRTPPPSYRIRLRKGMWNRRGDHLTVDGFVVYAPADSAYPDELRDYPDEAYRDHMGMEIPYLAARPELPESLPRFGQAPRQPYEKFIVYEYFQ